MTAVNLAYGLIPAKQQEGSLMQFRTHASVSQRLLPKMFRSALILKVRAEDESGSNTTKMSQLSRMKRFWPDLKHWINVKKLLITP